jgi:hypothetical protein
VVDRWQQAFRRECDRSRPAARCLYPPSSDAVMQRTQQVVGDSQLRSKLPFSLLGETSGLPS